MVLLCPTANGLCKLLTICEEYAAEHGLVYNVKKSEMMVFRARGKKPLDGPPVTLMGTKLKSVSQFKYLGHIVTADLLDNCDIERERRALAVRCNMLARRFARCTKEVKITLFKAFCQTFYTCSLWCSYSQRTYNALRVQYNNAFRMLMGLPRFCSASTMFAQAGVDDFYAIIRKRTASMLDRVRRSVNSILVAIKDRPSCSLFRHWIHLHVQGAKNQFFQ
ncbi:hypothetical protein ABMA27_000629 [Loxostege sticticalis]|uniref:Reverse transcriptase n=1 Tax=Loxostege sticticalis TaxID=481309 RepID=A0ABR3I016_LOXSC